MSSRISQWLNVHLKKMFIYISEWMDALMDRSMVGGCMWVDRWMDGWMDEWMDRWMDG